MALNPLKLLFSIFLFLVVKQFPFVEPRTLLEASERKGQRVKGVAELKSYLKRFGYLRTNYNSSDNNHFDENVELALKRYQVFHNLRATGHVDAQTLKRMGRPRCGVPDIITPHSLANYTFFNGAPKWSESKRALTYTFASSAYVLGLYDARRAIKNAFQTWSRVSDFTFNEIPSEYYNYNNQANIVLGFHRRDHGDGYPFDGPGQVLAHTFAPEDGRLHFDADELWSTDQRGWGWGWSWRWGAPRWQSQRDNIDLETVALHEIGHVLGLGHSRVQGSIMYPSYEGTRRTLSQDDVDGIRALYGLDHRTRT